jgi:quercetin dioxygenase-like cupin family protein
MQVPLAIVVSLCMLSSGAQSQTPAEQEAIRITRSGTQPPRPVEAGHITGSARIDTSFQGSAPARVSGARVRFEPGARTAWHTHPLGQTLIVTAGTGRVQRWGDPIDEIRQGDVVWSGLDELAALRCAKGRDLRFPGRWHASGSAGSLESAAGLGGVSLQHDTGTLAR